MLKVLFLCLFFSTSVFAAPRDWQQFLDSAPSAPVKLNAGKKISWAEYCPDNTCDVIRVRRSIDRLRLSVLAVSYFFYFSDYTYLEDWRSPSNVAFANDFLKENSQQCGAAEGREMARCLLLNAHKSDGLEVIFIRYDEGKAMVQKIDLDAELK